MKYEIYKDEKRNTWFCQITTIRIGLESKSRWKRGFTTRRDAQQWGHDFTEAECQHGYEVCFPLHRKCFEMGAPRLKERSTSPTKPDTIWKLDHSLLW